MTGRSLGHTVIKRSDASAPSPLDGSTRAGIGRASHPMASPGAAQWRPRVPKICADPSMGTPASKETSAYLAKAYASGSVDTLSSLATGQMPSLPALSHNGPAYFDRGDRGRRGASTIFRGL